MAQAMPFIMAGMAVASTAVGAISSIQAGQAEKKAGERQAAQLEASAAQAKKAAALKAADVKKEHQRIIATQTARYGASGVTMEGTPLLVQMESIKESEEQLRRILETGEIGATGYEESAEEARIAGTRAATSGYVGGVKSLLSGATEVGKIGRTYDWW